MDIYPVTEYYYSRPDDSGGSEFIGLARSPDDAIRMAVARLLERANEEAGYYDPEDKVEKKLAFLGEALEQIREEAQKHAGKPSGELSFSSWEIRDEIDDPDLEGDWGCYTVSWNPLVLPNWLSLKTNP